ncbi:hypothetical protein BT96DRAFT_993605 [Gymnopus androsaceus JB14]|uniref:Protein kinase domain-containing protein n=1 Tax=Gymnopus androsaceus JB14 TaxID=1447944 RepID=A0A6A4HSU9_9AGAR|nr:hypothetical protein BT96DRAFT_993605 [Gymnopus androsaceus JB14]
MVKDTKLQSHADTIPHRSSSSTDTALVESRFAMRQAAIAISEIRSWSDAWLPSEPVEYSEVWKKSIERGGLEKWCTRLYFPKALRELKLHSSTNPDHVDILFTLPSDESLPAPVPQFWPGYFLHAAVIANPSVDLNAEVYFVYGRNRVRWKNRDLCEEISPNDKFIIALNPSRLSLKNKRAYLQIPSTSDTPSTAGKAEIFHLRQETDKYMDCGRPAERAPQIPPSLYSSILAEAIDCNGPGAQAKMLILNKFLAKYGMHFDTGFNKNHPTEEHVKSLLADLVTAGIYFHGMCILEGKNEVGQSGADAFFQGLLYYQAAVNAASSYELNTNFPALLLVLVGNSLQLFTCVFTKRPTSVLISEYTFGYDQSNEKQQERGLRIVHGMLSTIQKLKTYYSSFQTSAITQPSFPYPRECSEVDTRSGRYGKDAHVFAAKEGVAPEIWGYQELSAGWTMVLMEDLTDTHRRFKPGEDNDDALKKSMAAFLCRLHAKGFVHGDIRDVNILVENGIGIGWRMIDWDWAGVPGIVQYPRHLTRRGLICDDRTLSKIWDSFSQLMTLRCLNSCGRLTSFVINLQTRSV